MSPLELSLHTKKLFSDKEATKYNLVLCSANFFFKTKLICDLNKSGQPGVYTSKIFATKKQPKYY